MTAAGPEGHMMAFDVATGEPRWPRPVEANPTFVIDEVRGVVFAQETGLRLVRASSGSTSKPVNGPVPDSTGSTAPRVTSPSLLRLRAPASLASCNEGAVALWSLDGDSPTGGSLGPLFVATNANQWSPDGRSLLVFDAADRAMLRDLRTGRHSPVDVEDPEGPWYFESNGALVHLANHPSDPERPDEIEIFDATGARTRSFAIELPDLISGGLAWNERTGVLAFGNEESAEVTFVDMDAGEVVESVDLGVGGAHGLEFSPTAAGSSQPGRTRCSRCSPCRRLRRCMRSTASPTSHCLPTAASSPPTRSTGSSDSSTRARFAPWART